MYGATITPKIVELSEGLRTQPFTIHLTSETVMSPAKVKVFVGDIGDKVVKKEAAGYEAKPTSDTGRDFEVELPLTGVPGNIELELRAFEGAADVGLLGVVKAAVNAPTLTQTKDKALSYYSTNPLKTWAAGLVLAVLMFLLCTGGFTSVTLRVKEWAAGWLRPESAKRFRYEVFAYRDSWYSIGRTPHWIVSGADYWGDPVVRVIPESYRKLWDGRKDGEVVPLPPNWRMWPEVSPGVASTLGVYAEQASMYGGEANNKFEAPVGGSTKMVEGHYYFNR